MRLTPAIIADHIWDENKPRLIAAQLWADIRGLVSALDDAIGVVQRACACERRAVPTGEGLLREIRTIKGIPWADFALKPTIPLLAELYCHCVCAQGLDQGWWANDESLPRAATRLFMSDMVHETEEPGRVTEIGERQRLVYQMNSIAYHMLPLSGEITKAAMQRLDIIRHSTSEPSLNSLRERAKMLKGIARHDAARDRQSLAALGVKLYAVANNAMFSGGTNPRAIEDEFVRQLSDAGLPHWIATDLCQVDHNPVILGIFDMPHTGSGDRVDPRSALLELRAAMTEADGDERLGNSAIWTVQPPWDLLNEYYPPDQRGLVELLWQQQLLQHKKSMCESELPAFESELQRLRASLARARIDAFYELDRITSTAQSAPAILSIYCADEQMGNIIAAEIRWVRDLRRIKERRELLEGAERSIGADLERVAREIEGFLIDDDLLNRLREEVAELFLFTISSPRLDRTSLPAWAPTRARRLATTFIISEAGPGPAAPISRDVSQQVEEVRPAERQSGHTRLGTMTVPPAWIPMAAAETVTVPRTRLHTLTPSEADFSGFRAATSPSHELEAHPTVPDSAPRPGYLGKIDRLVAAFHGKLTNLMVQYARAGNAMPAGSIMHMTIVSESESETLSEPLPTMPLLAELVACHLIRCGLQKGIHRARLQELMNTPGHVIEIPEAVIDVLFVQGSGLAHQLEDIGKGIFSVGQGSLECTDASAFHALVFTRNTPRDPDRLEFRSQMPLLAMPDFQIDRIDDAIEHFYLSMQNVARSALRDNVPVPEGVAMYDRVRRFQGRPVPSWSILAELVICHLVYEAVMAGVSSHVLKMKFGLPDQKLVVSDSFLDALFSRGGKSEKIASQLKEIAKVIFAVSMDVVMAMNIAKRGAFVQLLTGHRAGSDWSADRFFSELTQL